MRTITTWGQGVALLALLCSCAQSRSNNGSGTDSTTHWLDSCSNDAECGGLECLCGVCNASCSGDAACSGLAADAVCEAVAPGCTDAVRSCAEAPPAAASAGAGAGGTAGQAGSEAPAAAGSPGGVAGMIDMGGIDELDPSCGRPWYQCSGCQTVRTLQGATRSLAACEDSDDCHFDLRLWPVIVLDESGCFSLAVDLTVRNSTGVVRTHHATLTDAAWRQATQLAFELGDTRAGVDGVTGCPTCEGVDSASLVLSGIDQLTQNFFYERGAPPAAFAAADAFVQALIDELLACEGPHVADCSINDVIDEAPSTGCDFTYAQTGTDSVVACTLPLDVERPCHAALDCLCRGPVPPFGPNTDVEGCIASWLEPRGAPTFVDVCGRDEATALRSLTEALQDFASTQSGTVSASPACDSLVAWY